MEIALSTWYNGLVMRITMVAREESETANHEKAREKSETATENKMLVFEYWKFASRFLTHSF
ncbi:hypothetical protein JG687_00015314, partial [Phytophthora cactorum]